MHAETPPPGAGSSSETHAEEPEPLTPGVTAAMEAAPAPAFGESSTAATLHTLSAAMARLERRLGQMLDSQLRQPNLHVDLTHQRMKINELGRAAINRMSSVENTISASLDGYGAENRVRQENISASVDSCVAGIADLRQELGGLYTRVEVLANTISARLDGYGAEIRVRQENISASVDSCVAGIADLRQELGGLYTRVEVLANTISARLDGYGAENRVRQEAIESALDAYRRDLRPPVISAKNVLVVLVDDFVVAVSALDWRMAAYYAFWGTLEQGLIRRFRGVVKPGMVVVDVGANIGIYSLHAARLLQGSGQLHSFEPTPRSFALLKANLAANGILSGDTIHLYQSAVTDRRGTEVFYIDENDSAWNSLYAGTHLSSIQVATVALDDVFAPGATVDVLKMDAEGAEPFVWRGMRRVLTENPQIRIFTEFAPTHLRRAGVEPTNFLEEITSAGFRVSRIEDYTGEAIPFDLAGLREGQGANLFLEGPQAA